MNTRCHRYVVTEVIPTKDFTCFKTECCETTLLVHKEDFAMGGRDLCELCGKVVWYINPPL